MAAGEQFNNVKLTHFLKDSFSHKVENQFLFKEEEAVRKKFEIINLIQISAFKENYENKSNFTFK